MERPTALSGKSATGLNGAKRELFTMVDNDEEAVLFHPPILTSPMNTRKQFHLENNQQISF